MLATSDRDRIFTIMRHKNHGMAQIRHMIALLKEAAGLVPDYAAFQSVCADNLRQAWHSDRLTGPIAQTGDLHNRRRAWLRLFRHLAPLHGIASDLRIRALDRSREYVCDLVAKPDRGPEWRALVLRAREFGIYANELEGLAVRADKRQKVNRVVGRRPIGVTS